MFKASRFLPQKSRTVLRFEKLEDRCLLANSFVHGVAYHDANQNDQLDVNDPRLSNAALYLYRGNEQQPLAEAFSDDQGFYYFDGVAPGNYRLVQVPPEGFVPRSAQANSQINPTSIPPGTRDTIQFTILDPALLSSSFSGFYSVRDLAPNAVRLFGEIPLGFQNQSAPVGQLRLNITRPGLPNIDIRSWCAELALASEFPEGRFTPEAARYYPFQQPLEIGYLFNTHGMRTDLTPTQAAALQLAFWELMYDTPSANPLGTGNFRYEITDAAVLQAANSFLAEAAGRSGLVAFNQSADPFYQGFLSSWTLNFGNVRGANIVGWKWNDQNVNRVWDRGEPGVRDWFVFLDRNNNAILDLDEVHTQTGANGQYRFNDLAPGTYRVCEVLPGATQSTYPGTPPCHSVTVTAGQTVTGRFEVAEVPNFGNRFVATIDAWKWDDRNGNGQWEMGDEPGLVGWTIQAVRNGQVVASAVTVADDPATPNFDETGMYCLMLEPGTYEIREVPQAGWRQTYPANSGSHTITLRADDYVIGEFGRAVPPNFGNQRLANLSGWKWHDADGDRTWDQGEPALGDWVIFLDRNNNARLDPNEPQTRTGNNGQYQFTGLIPGTHRVCEVYDPMFVTATYPGEPPCHTVNLEPGQSLAGRFGFAEVPNFGNRILAMIDAYKWFDRNGNGAWDADEPGLAGWTIEVVRNGQVIQRTVTMEDDPRTPDFNETGIYWLTLEPGTYLLREVLRPGWQQTYPENDEGHIVTLEAGQFIVGEYGSASPPNFGNTLQSVLSGWQWNDRDGNGRWDRGEPAFANSTVFLDLNWNGQLDATDIRTVTGANGQYRFNSLRPGTYGLCDVAPTGWEHSYPQLWHCREITLVPGQTLAGGFEATELPNSGVRPLPARLHGWVWNDLNGDGRWDGNEPPVPYRLIELVQNGIVVASAWSAEDDPTTPAVNERGEYWLEAPAGTYTIRYVTGDDWGQTYPAAGHTVTLVPGQFLNGSLGATQIPNFAAQALVPVIAWKWHDRNGNGEWDAGEPALAGWTVELLRNNVVVGRAVSRQDDPQTPENETGLIWFWAFPGTYQLREVNQGGWNRTYPNGPGMHNLTLRPGEFVASYFGNTEPPSFAGCRPGVDACTNGPGSSPGGSSGWTGGTLLTWQREETYLPAGTPDSEEPLDLTLAQMLVDNAKHPAGLRGENAPLSPVRVEAETLDAVFASNSWLSVELAW